MNRTWQVFVDLGERPVPCGTLWTRGAPRHGCSFEYDSAWLRDRRAFALDPELPLSGGQFHTQRALFRTFADASPDRWGQSLLRRAERARARREGRAVRTLTEVDCLVLVADETRHGALRLRDASAGDEGPFLASGGRPVPPLVDLRRLLAATRRVLQDRETDDDLATLLAPGTSLGGARPKASVRGTDGKLWMAKFPAPADEWPQTAWEAVAMALARAARVQVAVFELQQVVRKPVLLVERFDRQGGFRVPFLSAMTALSADDGEARSYLEIADAIRRDGSAAAADLKELWRRLVFNVLVSNTDDHLRNHGFLHDGVGWKLAPAYDLNPIPADVRPRIHALALDETDATSSMETAFAIAPRFGLGASEARTMARQVARAVRGWRKMAAGFGLKPRQIERMESAFEHRDAELAAS